MARHDTATRSPSEGRFPAALVYEAARLYYFDQATQAQIAEQLGTSRPTVSRLLAEARDTGIVEIRLREPKHPSTADLEQQLVESLGLAAAYVAASAAGVPIGRLLAGRVADALTQAQLSPGDALLVSSGLSVFGIAQQPLPALPGVQLCPTVGGVEEPEPHYQTNEITRALALKVNGVPVMLYAPALPSAPLHAVLMDDPQVRRVTQLWKSARAALLGIGAPPHHRSSLPSVISSAPLYGAVGDICARPYDAEGSPLDFPGIERLVAMTLDDLRRVEHSIGIAIGAQKVESIAVAVRAGYVNTLVTDSDTAQLLMSAASDSLRARSPRRK